MSKEEIKKKETKTTTKKKETPKKSSSSKKVTATKTSPAKKETKTSKAAKNSTKKQTTIIQEENSYGRTMLAAVLIALVLLGGYIAVRLKGDNNETKYVATADEKAFKSDFEGLNGTTYSDGTKVSKVEIIKDNNIVYISMEEAAKMLDSGTGVIYFGYASCPYCRASVPALLEAMSASELDKIYYVNLRPESKEVLTGVGTKENDLRDEYTLNNKNKAKKTLDAEESYYEVLTALANYLDDYILVTDKGKEVSTGEKRLYGPTMVAVKEGEILGFHQGTVETHKADDKGVLKDLTSAEYKELVKKYAEIISKSLK